MHMLVILYPVPLLYHIKSLRFVNLFKFFKPVHMPEIKTGAVTGLKKQFLFAGAGYFFQEYNISAFAHLLLCFIIKIIYILKNLISISTVLIHSPYK